MSSRNIEIDTLRGVACFLLVAFHVVGVNSDTGLRLESGLYREINDMLAYIRMPLFTFLSGIVYAYRPFSEGAKHYLKGKVRRLIIPMLVVGTLFAILQSIIPGTNSSIDNWQLLHIKPVAHFWFVEAIFLIFLLMIPLEKVAAFKTKTGFMLVFLISSILYVSDLNSEYFSFSGALYLLPYFLLGMAIQRFSIINILNVKVGLFLVVVVTALIVSISVGILTIDGKRTLLGLMLGVIACIGLLSIRFKSKLISKIGSFSYSIYIYHVFFTAATRIALNKLGVSDVNILFCISLMLGILGPIVIENFFNGTNFTRAVMLGKSKASIEALWITRRFNQ
jgi:fucose 4-O-acetylase-like acetyltransferase